MKMVFENTLFTLIFTIITVNCQYYNDVCELIPDYTFIGDPSSCGWIRCVNGTSNKGQCPRGHRFNYKHGVCDSEKNVNCNDDVCNDNTNGQFFADKTEPRRCSAYFYCKNGKAYHNECSNGLIFNEKKSMCDYNDGTSCINENNINNIMCANIPDGITVRNKDDCRKYYICKNGKINEIKSCKSPELYNLRTGKCDHADNVECNIYCEADRKPKRDPKSCRSYYECIGNFGQPKLIKCGENEFVKQDANGKFTCMKQIRVDDDSCPNRCEGRNNGFVPAFGEPKCQKYYSCQNGYINGETPHACKKGKLFDDLKQGCIDASKVNTDTCETKLDEN